MKHPADIENLKKVIKAYVREGYTTGTTSSFVRDVLTVLSDIPEFNFVKDELNAGIAKLRGC